MVAVGRAGAGEGNRTLVISLEGCCSTIELHPHCRRGRNRSRLIRRGIQCLLSAYGSACLGGVQPPSRKASKANVIASGTLQVNALRDPDARHSSYPSSQYRPGATPVATRVSTDAASAASLTGMWLK